MADYTILLIDYDPRSIDRLRAPLLDQGYHVEVARNGAAGVDTFKRIHPDLCIVEAMLPRLHGFDVCRAIKATEKSSPVIIVSSMYKGQSHRRQALQAGCDGYLPKPVDELALIAAVRSFLPTTGAQESAAADEEPEPSVENVPQKTQKTDPGTDKMDAQARSSGEQPSDSEVEIMERLDAILPEEPVRSRPRREPPDPDA